MRVLGFSVGHDKGAVIIEDGKIAVGISQERISRIRHDGGHSGGRIPFESINYCLDYLGITYKDIDYYVYSTTELVDDVDEFVEVSDLCGDVDYTHECDTACLVVVQLSMLHKLQMLIALGCSKEQTCRD